MKTSKAQQEETRARIVRSAVELIQGRGYDAVTMKDIAKAAGIGDATIYKYFPTKERLILGYFDALAEQAVAATRETPDFISYDLHAKLQRLTDAVLEAMAPDRVFIEVARGMLAKSPLLMLGDQLKAKQTLKEAVAAYLDAAAWNDEIPPSDYFQAMAGLYVDFCYGVIAFWLRDTTDHAAETTRLVDQVLGVIVTMLKAGLPDRLVQLAGFVLRSQLARVLDRAAAGPSRTSPPSQTAATGPSAPPRQRPRAQRKP